MTIAQPILRCEGVTARYPGSHRDAVSGYTMTIAPAEHVALLGLNGSGKTSLLMAIAFLLSHAGTIEIDGRRLTESTAGELRRKIGFLFSTPEDQLLFPRVLDDVAFSLTQRGVDRAVALQRSRDMLEAMGAADLADAGPYDLSHGQRMRVALAGVLVAEPPLLLLDEPSAALDPPGKANLARLLAELPSAMVIATHDLTFAEASCTRRMVMSEGKLLADSARGDAILL